MFVPTPDQLAGDWADRMVDFGPYVYSEFSDSRAPNFVRSLPRRPPVAADYDAGQRCRCPSCVSEGWYAVSPLCHFWRATCEACAGRRVVRAPGARVQERCGLCDEEWARDVWFFRHALRSPRRVAARLRGEALRAAARSAEDQTKEGQHNE
jgi:hypothetical protein